MGQVPESAAESGATEVTAAGIARLAGVGRAAVSNWRRRHPDFPKPVGGTETSPSFALAEVERWLRDQGKLAEVPLRERVWQQIAGHPAGAVTALVHAGCALLLVRDRSAAWPSLAELPDERLVEVLPVALEETLTERIGPERAVLTPTAPALKASVPLLRGAAELAAETGVREAFEFLLGRHLDANPRQYTLTPPGPRPSWRRWPEPEPAWKQREKRRERQRERQREKSRGRRTGRRPGRRPPPPHRPRSRLRHRKPAERGRAPRCRLRPGRRPRPRRADRPAPGALHRRRHPGQDR